MIFSRFACTALLVAALSGCSSVPRLVTEYRIDVQQGNVLTQEMVSQLRPGLSREQVRFILGTPLLVDMFHADRWDYVYRLQKGKGGEPEARKFTVFFDAEGKLARVAGDVVAAQPGQAGASAEAKTRVIDLGTLPEGSELTLPPTKGPGFFGKIRESIGL